MDHYSILEQNPPAPAVKRDAKSADSGGPRTSISAKIAESDTTPPKFASRGMRFAEDSGQTLEEMAAADLDAALQLLADRAQYITGASGAAIALRRGDSHDMVCRASTGSNAPQLGEVLSMNRGLTGECARTRQAVRCDDATQDARVNGQVCMELGIASALVAPICGEAGVLGVFQLFSGKPRAFHERDLSTLMRLSQMVETAVKQAEAARSMPRILKAAENENDLAANDLSAELNADPLWKGSGQAGHVGVDPTVDSTASGRTAQGRESDSPPRGQGLFWSAALRTQAGTPAVTSAGEPRWPAIPAFPTPRNLKKCQACGFPVSQSRDLCVECEEKKWRGLPISGPKPEASMPTSGVSAKNFSSEPAPNKQAAADVAPPIQSLENNSETATANLRGVTAVKQAPANLEAKAPSSDEPPTVPEPAIIGSENLADGGAVTLSGEHSSREPMLFASANLESRSWLAKNAYVLGTLLLGAAIAAAAIWLR